MIALNGGPLIARCLRWNVPFHGRGGGGWARIVTRAVHPARPNRLETSGPIGNSWQRCRGVDRASKCGDPPHRYPACARGWDLFHSVYRLGAEAEIRGRGLFHQWSLKFGLVAELPDHGSLVRRVCSSPASQPALCYAPQSVHRTFHWPSAWWLQSHPQDLVFGFLALALPTGFGVIVIAGRRPCGNNCWEAWFSPLAERILPTGPEAHSPRCWALNLLAMAGHLISLTP